MSACSVGRVLQLDHRHRQAVDEAHHVGPARLLGALHRELVHHQKAVVAPAARNRSAAHGRRASRRRCSTSTGTPSSNASWKARLLWISDGSCSLATRCATSSSTVSGISGFRRRSASSSRSAAPPAGSPRAPASAVRRDVGAVAVVPAGVLEPGEGELFEVVFVNHPDLLSQSRDIAAAFLYMHPAQ